MTVVSRDSVKEPTLPKETVSAPAIGGDVVVRGMLMAERMGFDQIIAGKRTAIRTDATAGAYLSGYEVLPQVLSICVLADDGKPLWTEAQWQAFGGRHLSEAAALFNVAWRLSGYDQEGDAKN
jgi:hypothetical protein